MNIEYTIKYSNRKTLGIIIERDSTVVVRAPLNTSSEAIEREIEKRKFNIYQKINHPQKYEKPRQRKEFVSGESLLYLGVHYKLELVLKEIEGVLYDNKFYISRSNQAKAEELFRKWYVKHAEEKIIPRVKFFAKNLGVQYSKIRILDLKYRWGSCTPKDSIHFNWRIVKAPVYVIDYIIVHELAHLLEANHTPEFWNIISIQLPNYENAKKWLKENGHLLEYEF